MKRILTVFILLFLGSCLKTTVVTRPEDALDRTSWFWAKAPHDDLEFKHIGGAVRQSIEYYKKIPPDTFFSFGPDRVTALDLLVTLQNFLLLIENDSLTYEQKVKRIKKEFVLYRSVGSERGGKVLFTGYYEPVLSCRYAADEVYKYPLYKRPEDIIEVDLMQFGSGFPRSKLYGRIQGKRLIPYFSREEIDQRSVLANKNLEALWCSDIVDIYFLQVQGSGKVDLGNGAVLSVLYDGQNGRSYRSIGKYLIDLGVIPREEMSMQIIRHYLRDNPEQIFSVLNQNPSYVFFRVDTGPSVGTIGVPLTAGRSIATDTRLFPKGALAFMASEKPVVDNGAITEWVPFTRFVLNQDTGGAIRGPGRADLFWGQGAEAEIGAGYMQHEGELYFLIRKK